MTYEQAVARAMLKIVREQLPMTLMQPGPLGDDKVRMLAVRRLRVRAGLKP